MKLFLWPVGIIDVSVVVDERVMSVGIHGGCLLEALRMRMERGGKVKVDIYSKMMEVKDMILCIFGIPYLLL